MVCNLLSVYCCLNHGRHGSSSEDDNDHDGGDSDDPVILTMAEATAIIARGDSVVKDTLYEMSDEDREKLMTVCINSIPNNEVSFSDFVIVIFALSKMGIIDFHNVENGRIKFNNIYGSSNNHYCFSNFHYGAHCSFTTDNNDGRIISLSIFIDSIDPNSDFDEYDLPAIICRSLPEELSNLPNLQSLRLHNCSNLQNKFPILVKLKQLKKLAVFASQIESASSPFFTWLVKELPSLEELEFVGMRRNETIYFFDFLCSVDGVCFKDTLKCLRMVHCNVDGEMFIKLLSSINSRLPNLSELDLNWNEIQAIQPPIVERNNNDDTDTEFVPSKQLYILKLEGNPIMSKNVIDDPEQEQTAMLSFLTTLNNTIYNLGRRKGSYIGTGNVGYDPNIEYNLRINHAGRRRIIEATTVSGDERSLSLSMWPTVLVRGYENSYKIYDWDDDTEENDGNKSKTKTADGVYDLFRNGLVGRPDWNWNYRVDSKRQQSSSSDVIQRP
ncbi:hypothetical protein FRACYDRAFT_241401 [Fragilariopsis cylindrus CCMP1102]|uniref:RNI-like protein n=1 Tax=Fragilariopsis cylindrus CCMP1102 TaxID=635003 RepID=A0A1E7F9M9_9STRA|nr:hypothetical protein FRACYDRAFT_241401 [Fragilariopsis cylindrus CCMP1102]|eukprot:OEU14844.1 hypothetical protein FRACYDRAFT_241401 [Fragilariopsis cylindrus CCMP1102]